MARIRTIKPEFFTSEDIVSLSPMARLLYIAMWCEADREGRMSWKPRTFKMRYLPADDIDIGALCQEILDAGLVVLYGDGLAYIPKFSTHQHVNPRESASNLPVPDASPRVSDAQVGREGRNGKEGKEGSVAKATGGEPPVDLKRELYAVGKSLLEAQGMPKAQCGSFITKLCTDYNNEIALEAVRSAVSTQPLEAAAYLKATCQRLKGERRDPITVPPDPAAEAAAAAKKAAEAEHTAKVAAETPDQRAARQARLAIARQVASGIVPAQGVPA